MMQHDSNWWVNGIVDVSYLGLPQMNCLNLFVELGNFEVLDSRRRILSYSFCAQISGTKEIT